MKVKTIVVRSRKANKTISKMVSKGWELYSIQRDWWGNRVQLTFTKER